jgi:hypothetical protein
MPSTSRFQKFNIMVQVAVSIPRKVVTNFRWIYPEGEIYRGLLLPASYPHFFGEPFVWDYLTNAIKV